MRDWGVTLAPGRLHYSQARCTDCGLVFSNPVCDWSELEAFYRDDYWESHWPEALSRDATRVAASVDAQRHELELLKRYAATGRLLEIGSGTGSFLAAARDDGFDPWGIETSVAAVQHSRNVFELQNILHGSMPDPRLPVASFDVVHAWHVVEHVVDLDAFIGSLRNLLKPGGLLWLGTENYKNAAQYLERVSFAMRGRPFPFATASEHTLVFNTTTLRNCFERRGFEVLLCEAYQPTFADKRKTMAFRNPLSFLYFALQHTANAIAGTGPLLRMAARRI